MKKCDVDSCEEEYLVMYESSWGPNPRNLIFYCAKHAHRPIDIGMRRVSEEEYLIRMIHKS